jgi:hypothetical protein
MLAVFISQRPEREEELMRKIQSIAAVLFLGVAVGASGIAVAMEESHPADPTPHSSGGGGGRSMGHKAHQAKHKKSTKHKHSSAVDFQTGYHAAYTLIYDKADYVGGIAALRALGYDDNADVATLIGYASRKLGRYDDAKLWYDRALAADPNHALTWSYYGMWHAEQGNLLKAKDDLEKVRTICGNTECREYRALKAVIDGTVTY